MLSMIRRTCIIGLLGSRISFIVASHRSIRPGSCCTPAAGGSLRHTAAAAGEGTDVTNVVGDG